MTKKLYDIAEIYVNRTSIIVGLYGDKEVTIDKDKFDAWLDRTGRLESREDTVQNGEHVQKEGIITLAEYYNFIEIEPDVYEYLVLHHYEDAFDIEKDLGSILSDFSS